MRTLPFGLRGEQGARCARVALGLSAADPAPEQWRVVVRESTRRPQ